MSGNDHVHRRDLFKIVGATLAAEALDAQHLHEQQIGLEGAPKDYHPRFFSNAEYGAVNELCSLLLPADNDSPGAAEAGVPWFLDTSLLYSDATRQKTWHDSLSAIDHLAQSRFGKKFLNCTPEQRTTIMSVLAENEVCTSSPAGEIFFRFQADRDSGVLPFKSRNGSILSLPRQHGTVQLRRLPPW